NKAARGGAPLGWCAKGVEILKEAGGQKPPASLKTSPLPRLGALGSTSYVVGGGVGDGVSSDRHCPAIYWGDTFETNSLGLARHSQPKVLRKVMLVQPPGSAGAFLHQTRVPHIHSELDPRR
ncbi:MAG: hypothetical protein HW376_1606, partial [candidate division NC10 bacterium]|nr:hypothetical protein [candidate division NC10 bacterium]